MTEVGKWVEAEERREAKGLSDFAKKMRRRRNVEKAKALGETLKTCLSCKKDFIRKDTKKGRCIPCHKERIASLRTDSRLSKKERLAQARKHARKP